MEMAHVGVRTRTRSALAVGDATSGGITSTPKRRKINDEQLKFSSSSFVQLKSTTPAVVKPENTLVPAAEAEERCSSPSSDEFQASCCSSNGSIGLGEERIKFEDLEVESAQVETSTCNSSDESRREMSPPSDLRTISQELLSTEKATEANSRSISTEKKMPTESELEEFFGAAEKGIQKRFADKYNYDIVKDMPLEGRYEWVRLKP